MIEKKNCKHIFDMPDEDLETLKVSLKSPDLNAPVVYSTIASDVFIYPLGDKDVYDTFSKDDKTRWTIFQRSTRNINMVNAYAKVNFGQYWEGL